MKKVCMFFAALLLCIGIAFPVSASEIPESEDVDIMLFNETHPARVVDEADLLTDGEENDLAAQLDEISERLQFDVAVVTVNSTNGQDIIDFTDDYYDYNGYGLGEDYDGAMLMIDMGAREFYISTCGYGITALGDDELSYISDQFLNGLSDGDYYDAFCTFASLCDDFVTAESGGSVSASVSDFYSDPNGYSSGGSTDGFKITGVIVMLVICLALGFLFAGIPMSRMKRQMKPVMLKAEARDYLKPDSRKITKSRDAFLYHTITRVPKPKQDSDHNGGSFGGGVHMGSSGRSHGGMGGRF